MADVAARAGQARQSMHALRQRHRWQQEAQALSQRAAVLDRERQALGARLRQSVELGAALGPPPDEAALRREVAGLAKALQACRQQLAEVQRLVRQGPGGRSQEQFLDSVSKAAHRLEANLLQFKAQSGEQMEALTVEEKLCNRQIKALEESLQQWEEAAAVPVTSSRRSVSPSARSSTPGRAPSPSAAPLPPEVRALQRFLAEGGGATGGWGREDHAAFLRLRCQTKTEEQLISRLVLEVPQQTEETARQHLQWYQQYLTLEEAQKEAVARWKAGREAERLRQLREQELQRAAEQTLQEQQQKERQQEEAARVAKRLAVQQWRETRRQEKEREELEAFAQAEEAATLKAKQEAEQQALKKVQVEQYRAARSQEREQVEAQRRALTPRPRAVATEELLGRHEQNLDLVRQRLQQMDRRDWRVAQQELHGRLAAYAAARRPLVARDLNRAAAPTAAVKARERCVRDGEVGATLAAAAETALLRGIKPTAPVPTRRTGRAMVAWRLSQ